MKPSSTGITGSRKLFPENRFGCEPARYSRIKKRREYRYSWSSTVTEVARDAMNQICSQAGVGLLQTDDGEIPNPTWQQMEEAIRKLDNRTYTHLYFYPNPNNRHITLLVSGGSGSYYVEYMPEDGIGDCVVDRTRPIDDVESLFVAGEVEDVSRRFVVNQVTALRAAKSFYQFGEFVDVPTESH